EGSVAAHPPDFRALVSWDRAITNQAAFQASLEADVLCFCDSQSKFGLLPRVIEAQTGRPAFNLAPVSGQAASSYFLLRRALEAGARPKAVLVNFMPRLLQLPLAHNAQQWPELLSPRDALDLCVTARDPDRFAAIMLARLLPSVRNRYQIRTNVLNA